MERSDRITFIIAATLVVLLLAGAGLLIWKRSQTLAAESTAVASSTVSLTPLETTAGAAPVTTTPTPATVSKLGVPKQPKGSDFGYVTKVRKSGSTVYATYDPAELLTGTEADLYIKKKGRVVSTAPYVIANDTHKFKTYDLTKKAIVDIIGADGRTKTVSPADYAAAFAKDASLHETTWWVWVSSGSITHIAQVPLPPLQ